MLLVYGFPTSETKYADTTIDLVMAASRSPASSSMPTSVFQSTRTLTSKLKEFIFPDDSGFRLETRVDQRPYGVRCIVQLFKDSDLFCQTVSRIKSATDVILLEDFISRQIQFFGKCSSMASDSEREQTVEQTVESVGFNFCTGGTLKDECLE